MEASLECLETLRDMDEVICLVNGCHRALCSLTPNNKLFNATSTVFGLMY